MHKFYGGRGRIGLREHLERVRLSNRSSRQLWPAKAFRRAVKPFRLLRAVSTPPIVATTSEASLRTQRGSGLTGRECESTAEWITQFVLSKAKNREHPHGQ